MTNDALTISANRDHPVNEWSDLDLLRAVAGEDERALRALYERHAPWLAVRLRRNLPASAVEDVLQETYLAVWRGASRFDGGGEPAAWLWGIGRRQAALWLRRHGQFAEPFDEVREATRPGTSDTAHEALTRHELQQAFAASGPPGSPGHDLARRVFIDNQPFGDIARDLDIPPGTVKSRVFALRRQIRAALGREESQ